VLLSDREVAAGYAAAARRSSRRACKTQNCRQFRLLLEPSLKAHHAHDSNQANARENQMDPTDNFSSEFESFPLKHDAADWSDVFSDNDWDDSDAQDIANEDG
jgi:hypothetical protein